MVDWRPILDGSDRRWRATLLRAGLRMFVPLYAGAVCFRNNLYDWGWRRSTRLKVPVVCIGNLTTGGTGKTPLVAWVARLLQASGRHPAILSRGYRTLDAAGNDEARVLAQLCPGVPHVQNRDRSAGGREAIDRFGCDLLVLDDGFQHRRLRRDVDIVLIDAVAPWGYGSLLPRGLLREPRRALSRASVVLLTRVDQVSPAALEQLRQEVQRETTAAIVGVSFPASGLVSTSGERLSLAALRGKRVGAFCGIGNPEGFRRRIAELCGGEESLAVRIYPDHHPYDESDFVSISNWGREESVELFVTTQKDLVKIPLPQFGEVPVYAVEIAVRFEFGEDALRGIILGDS